MNERELSYHFLHGGRDLPVVGIKTWAFQSISWFTKLNGNGASTSSKQARNDSVSMRNTEAFGQYLIASIIKTAILFCFFSTWICSFHWSYRSSSDRPPSYKFQLQSHKLFVAGSIGSSSLLLNYIYYYNHEVKLARYSGKWWLLE